MTESVNVDGWTKNDLIYIWKDKGALQFAGNILLQMICHPPPNNLSSFSVMGGDIQFL